MLLVRHAENRPVFHQLLAFHQVPPVAGQLVQVPVGVTLLYRVIQRLQNLHMSLAGGGTVMTILGVKLVKVTFVGLVQRLSTGEMKALRVSLAQRKKINRRRQRGIDGPEFSANIVIFVARCPVTVEAV